MKQKTTSQSSRTLPIVGEVEPNAAGLDVGARKVYVAVPADRDAQPVRSFDTFTEDLERMANWLRECGITSVAMESTGCIGSRCLTFWSAKGCVCVWSTRIM